MTEADGIKALILEVGSVLRTAVADGSAATQLGYETVANLDIALVRMRDSRATALQEIGNLQEAEELAQRLFSQTVSAEASDVLAQLARAREQVTNYVNHLANRIKETEKFVNLLNHWVNTEMSESGSHVQVAAEKLTELYNRY